MQRKKKIERPAYRNAVETVPIDYWTLAQSGGYLHVSIRTMRRRIRENRLKIFKSGARTLLRAADVRGS